jgi:hypothetical protein
MMLVILVLGSWSPEVEVEEIEHEQSNINLHHFVSMPKIQVCLCIYHNW